MYRLVCSALPVFDLAGHPTDEVIRKEARSQFDIIGLVLSMLGVVLVVYGLNVVSQTDPTFRTSTNPRGTINSWTYGPVWLWIGAGLVLLTIFVVYSLRRADPVLDMRLYKCYEFSITSFIVWVTRAASYAGFLLIPIFLQQVHVKPLSVQEAGLYLIPQELASALGVLSG